MASRPRRTASKVVAATSSSSSTTAIPASAPCPSTPTVSTPVLGSKRTLPTPRKSPLALLHVNASEQLHDDREYQKLTKQNSRTKKKKTKDNIFSAEQKKRCLIAARFAEAGYSVIEPGHLLPIAVEEGFGGTPNARLFGRSGLKSLQAVFFSMITKEVWTLLKSTWNIELMSRSSQGHRGFHPITDEEFWFMIGAYFIGGAEGLVTLDSVYSATVDMVPTAKMTKGRFKFLHRTFPNNARPTEFTDLMTGCFGSAFEASSIVVIDETMWFASFQAHNIRDREIVALARKPAGMGLLGYFLCSRAAQSGLPYVVDYTGDRWYDHLSPCNAAKRLVARLVQRSPHLGRHLFVDAAFSTNEMRLFLQLIDGWKTSSGYPLIDVTMSGKGGWDTSLWDAMQLGLGVNQYRLATRINPDTQRSESALCFSVSNMGKQVFINRFSTAYARDAAPMPRLPTAQSPHPSSSSPFTREDAHLLLQLSPAALQKLALMSGKPPEGTAADVVANLTGLDILRMDAIRDQESVIDYLAPEPDDAELIKHRVFVDSRTRTVFTVQQLTACTKPVLERLCVGHLKSSGARNKGQLIRWMLRCEGCSISLDSDQHARSVLRLSASDTSFAPTAVQTQSGEFKKEMNMHPMADAYKSNFNLIDRFDRSLSHIRLQLQFGCQHQRYHQALLFVGIVNSWTIFLESQCSRTGPIDVIRRRYPLKEELRKLGALLATPGFVP